MLAETCEDISLLQFPVLCTPKLDGFRCLKINGKALSRSFKPIRNNFARQWIEANVPDGCDGELMLRNGTFSETAGALARESGEPDFVFQVFDYVSPTAQAFGYESRMVQLGEMILPDRCEKIIPVMCDNAAELTAFEEKCLAEGYEGVMMRTPSSPYKCGRSSVREGYLLKLKRFADSEAVILETFEKQQNTNEATEDAFGRTKRSSAQAGKVGLGVLGAFKVRDIKTGCEFNIAFNHTTSELSGEQSWNMRAALIGQVVKYKYQPSGMKDAPRFPTMLGYRPAWDMSK